MQKLSNAVQGCFFKLSGQLQNTPVICLCLSALVEELRNKCGAVLTNV